MTLDGRMLYFTSAATIRPLLEARLKEIQERKKGAKWWRFAINYFPLNFNEPVPLMYMILEVIYALYALQSFDNNPNIFICLVP
jgi:hypothetical protein